MTLTDQRTQEPEPVRRELNPSKHPGREVDALRRAARPGPAPAPRADYERFCVDWFLPEPADRAAAATAQG